MSEEMESLLEFPCEFPIKVIGRAESELDTLVFQVVRRHAPDLGEGAIQRRLSREGNYESVTVTVEATSRAQLDEIYRDLTARDDILMVL